MVNFCLRAWGDQGKEFINGNRRVRSWTAVKQRVGRPRSSGEQGGVGGDRGRVVGLKEDGDDNERMRERSEGAELGGTAIAE